MDARGVVDAWLGRGAVTRVVVGAWRAASLVSGLVLVAPVMDVGRRPYRLGRLADRLEAVRDMVIIPDALPTQLRWFQVAVVATVAGGLVLPTRFRRAHLLVSIPAFALAILVRHGATESDWTRPTAQLSLGIAALGFTAALALVPVPSRRARRP